MRPYAAGLIMIFAFILIAQPYALQYAYENGTMTKYMDQETPIVDHYSYACYYNTTGHWTPTGSLAETQIANSTSTRAMTATAQDLTKRAWFEQRWSTSTIINATAWDSDADEYITAIGVRFVVGTVEDKPMLIYAGFGDFGSQYYNVIANGVPITTNEETVTILYVPVGFYTQYAAHQAAIDLLQFKVYFVEENADQIIDAAVMETQIEFYSGSNLDTFNLWLGGMGIVNILIAVGCTRVWDPLRGRR